MISVIHLGRMTEITVLYLRVQLHMNLQTASADSLHDSKQ